jgi:hypothetical protein
MMKAKAREQSQDSTSRDVMDSNPDLDNRYGRIGISAVAAAVRYRSDQRGPKLRVVPLNPYDRD